MIEKCKMRKFLLVKFHAFSLQLKKILKMNPFTGLFQTLCLDFEWLLSNFGMQCTPFTDSCRWEAAITSPGKTLKN